MLREFIKSVREKVRPRSSSDQRFQFMEVGFHGDLYLMELVDLLMASCGSFLETGSNVGSTLSYVCRKYPTVQCFSCEPDPEAFEHARSNAGNCSNVHLYNEMSQAFMKRMTEQNESGALTGDTFFWLDAHDYGFEWPLRGEVDLITTHWDKGYILIDDFLVPGLDCFGYDQYEDQVCSFDFIKDSLNKNRRYRLYYPAYTDKTSKTHPLRGWGLIEFGHDDMINLPPNLKHRITESPVAL